MFLCTLVFTDIPAVSGSERIAPYRLDQSRVEAYTTGFSQTSIFGVLRMSIVNILRGLPCRLESLCLKFTNEPSIFVDGDLAELIKRSASDRLGELVP